MEANSQKSGKRNNHHLRQANVSHRFFNFKDLNGKKKSIEIPEKACKIHITWGSDLSNKGVFLWYQLMGDWKIHCLSRTQWMCNLEHFTKQLESWLLNEG